MSTHFSVSVHCLLLLSLSAPERITSADIAGSVNTNPVVVRRILGGLKKAGLVNSSPGTRGFYLAKPSSDITLDMIYQAAKDEGPLFPIHGNCNPNCEVGIQMDSLLTNLYQIAESKVEQFFASITLEDMERSCSQQIETARLEAEPKA
ncbi:Rrf2 family transcriptional regulator [Paenibacillus barcinonensis]|uniref:Rrf2 family protein n=1 Tax=Paenibacillus barcinonensis TaxID=198119 RepID=A0A2V4W102_PAEBA|nr:Rrf2 family transcriptional regulator [Paenibacillus barcinonensis]PYE52073.1 Rrf2 family protein [Paenibacillus barcinonensis]QKS59779.1 Rrf2 family transcriptional regulator [Paenibacillus barcinonensis]